MESQPMRNIVIKKLIGWYFVVKQVGKYQFAVAKDKSKVAARWLVSFEQPNTCWQSLQITGNHPPLDNNRPGSGWFFNLCGLHSDCMQSHLTKIMCSTLEAFWLFYLTVCSCPAVLYLTGHFTRLHGHKAEQEPLCPSEIQQTLSPHGQEWPLIAF